MPDREEEINLENIESCEESILEDIEREVYENEIAEEADENYGYDVEELADVPASPDYFYGEEVEWIDINSGNIDKFFKKYDERRKFRERKISSALLIIDKLSNRIDKLEKENFELKNKVEQYVKTN
jgi:hypothetical protein